MAKIQTTTRLINVLETLEEVRCKMDLQWFELTEDITFHGAIRYERKKASNVIFLNIDYIVEIYD